MAPIDPMQLPEPVRRVLTAHGFDHVPFADFTRRLAEAGFDPERNRLRVPIEPPPADAIVPLPPAGSSERARHEAVGRTAIAAGQVGAVVLNGGMATRFGGMVKGAVAALDGRSFLDLKLRQIERASGGRAPVLLMNSFATQEATARHLADLGLAAGVRAFTQMVSLRLTPTGDLFLGDDGLPSLHATGHGDLPFALVRSGELARFVAGGGRWLVVSNVDNLGAGLDPAIVGLHITLGRPMSVEVAPKDPGDVGGVPARVGGRLTVVEEFRLPRGFDSSVIPVFNTNTFVFDAAALAEPWPLDWFAVAKKVDGRTAIQFERLVGQVADFVDASWIRVPRTGPESRFLPIKVPADLEARAPTLRAVMQAQGVI